ncbi:conserved hypothetical protein [Altererythrobacter sp. B11]|uniref:hypothetical protein n=1 Tax=Altererythrobacter sp. B11 TaxID=2060312 RepID=UPI000DC72828|nr:hypothetical protein [Altererythrobacter sp. B11]BBC72938.1 conserved hypothetical protein [Altererythrobacter sp. B11]
MPRRSIQQSKYDELAFPIRIRFRVPPGGIGEVSYRLHDWMIHQIGSGACAQHSSSCLIGSAFALHFRRIEDAARCIAEFPELELADAIDSPAYISPYKGRDHGKSS